MPARHIACDLPRRLIADASELVALRWDDIDLSTGRLHVRRAKSGDASVHPVSARESRALRKLLREAPTSPYLFTT
jgi:integrase